MGIRYVFYNAVFNPRCTWGDSIADLASHIVEMLIEEEE